MNTRAVRRAGPSADANAQRESAERLALVARAKARDREAFAALYRERVAAISRYVQSMVRDPHRAEDVVAQTFMLAWKSLPTLRRDDRFEAWLYRIAYRETLRELRRQQALPLESAPDAADTSGFTSPDVQYDVKADSELVRDALLHLPPAQRDVLVLRFFDDLSHTEVSRMLGKSEIALRALQHRALKNLRRLLRDVATEVNAGPTGDSRGPAGGRGTLAG